MRNRRPTSWLLGFAGSAVVHVCAVGGAVPVRPCRSGGWPARRRGVRSTRSRLPRSIPRSPAPIRWRARFAVDIAPAARAWDAHEGDRDDLVPLTTAPSDSDGKRRLAPAPDQGAAGGHPPDHAFRRDNSTLRSRLTDGAAEAQPARTRTAGRPRLAAGHPARAGRRHRRRGAHRDARAGRPRRRRRSRSPARTAPGRSGRRPTRPPPARRRPRSRRLSSPRWRSRRAPSGRWTPNRARAASTTNVPARPPTTTRCAPPPTSRTRG